jgi:hypothetical protein
MANRMFPAMTQWCAMVIVEQRGHPAAERILSEARRLVGVRFRPQGRDLSGLDCVGLVWLAAARAGVLLPDRRDYPLRPNCSRRVAAMLREEGFCDLDPGGADAGDLLLMEPVRDQVHLCLMSDRGVIEACAGLRRVVERPWRADDSALSAYRFPGVQG